MASTLLSGRPSSVFQTRVNHAELGEAGAVEQAASKIKPAAKINRFGLNTEEITVLV